MWLVTAVLADLDWPRVSRVEVVLDVDALVRYPPILYIRLVEVAMLQDDGDVRPLHHLGAPIVHPAARLLPRITGIPSRPLVGKAGT
jgi:hypothetical protein